MKTLHISTIIATVFFILFLTSHVYAQCMTVNGASTCIGMKPYLISVKSDKLNYENSDKPVITITGVPNKLEYLEIDNHSGNIIFSHSIELPSTGVVNYTLDISSYKPDIYSANVNTSTGKTTTSFAVGLVPSGERIDLFSSKPSYTPNETIQITGFWSPNTIINLDLVDPTNKIQNFTMLQSNSVGNFTKKFVIPSDAINGTWQVRATSGLVHSTLYISVMSQNLQQNPSVQNGITSACCYLHGTNSANILQSPSKQFKSGIAANDVKCEQGFQLVIKAEDDSPACVKPQTAQKLVERGWGWAMQPIDSLKPLLPNRIAGLENDTGIVTFGNRTYYFETPHYTQDAYVNPVHISFHGVVFTLFPPGFKGGLPTNFGGVAANGCSGGYFWTDAKFPDGTHALLNIFALTTMSQQCLSLPAQTYFSTHTDPLAGLTFYDGKLKLLVSVEGRLQQSNSVFSTPIPTNETIYHNFPHPPGYSIINSTQGIIVNNDAGASNLTGFSVKSPTDLPQGYKVKLIKASKIPMVTIFVSKYPLTNNTTSDDFLWNQQGILITYQQTSPHELENFKYMADAANKTITIAGTPTEVFDISKEYNNGYPYDMWATLIAIKDNNTSIAIRGFFNSDDLIKIATSMLEK